MHLTIRSRSRKSKPLINFENVVNLSIIINYLMPLKHYLID